MTAVTLLTDFGTADGYVGEMKGVLLSGGAGRLVDVSHDAEQGDVRAGAWALRRIWSRFPAGTVHLVVVDPGVAAAAARWRLGPAAGGSWGRTTASSPGWSGSTTWRPSRSWIPTARGWSRSPTPSTAGGGLSPVR